MRIDPYIKEKLSPLFSEVKPPDVAILGGIEVEHTIKKCSGNYSIDTFIGGNGTRTALELKGLGIIPSILAFLGQDEFLNMILNFLDSKNISVRWTPNNLKTQRRLTFTDTAEVILQRNDYIITINPIFIEEFIYNVKAVLVNVERWNVDIIDFLSYEKKMTFVHADLDIIDSFSFSCKTLFIKSNDIHKALEAASKANYESMIIFAHDEIYFDGLTIKPDICSKEYRDQAVSVYEAVFIESVLHDMSYAQAHEYAFRYFAYVLANGSKIENI